ncbi:MAG: POTRA domain-containing protein, partial [Ignavibacteria bacterium]
MLSMVTKKGALFSPEQFTTDLMTIRSRYKNDGYLFVKFNNSGLSYNEDSSLVDITISIDEGQVVTLGKIDINGNTELKDAQILSALNIGSGDVLNDKA